MDARPTNLPRMQITTSSIASAVSPIVVAIRLAAERRFFTSLPTQCQPGSVGVSTCPGCRKGFVLTAFEFTSIVVGEYCGRTSVPTSTSIVPYCRLFGLLGLRLQTHDQTTRAGVTTAFCAGPADTFVCFIRVRSVEVAGCVIVPYAPVLSMEANITSCFYTHEGRSQLGFFHTKINRFVFTRRHGRLQVNNITALYRDYAVAILHRNIYVDNDYGRCIRDRGINGTRDVRQLTSPMRHDRGYILSTEHFASLFRFRFLSHGQAARTDSAIVLGPHVYRINILASIGDGVRCNGTLGAHKVQNQRCRQ